MLLIPGLADASAPLEPPQHRFTGRPSRIKIRRDGLPRLLLSGGNLARSAERSGPECNPVERLDPPLIPAATEPHQHDREGVK